MTGQSEIDREGMERRDRQSLTLLLCDCSLCKVRRLAEGRQMQTKRRGKGGGREWDGVRQEEKSAWVASLPTKTSERGGGVRSAGRSAGHSAINQQKPHPKRPNPRHCCVINIHTHRHTALQSVRQYPCTTEHVTALTINN